MKILNECYVYFGLIGGDFDPDQVSALVGVKATKAKRKGNPIPKASYWQYGTDHKKAELIDVYELSSNIIRDLTPHIHGILKAKDQFQLESVLEVVLWISPEESISTPAIGFGTDVIQFLQKTGTTIDIDTYRSSRDES